MRRGQERPGNRNGWRGQSSVLGVVLILGVLVAGLAVVTVLGGAALSDTEDELSTARAQKVMTQFDSQSALVALGEVRSRRTELPRGPGAEYEVREDAGWINVSVTNVSAENSNVTTIVNRSMGALVYENGRATVAYQAGGVWRESGAEAVMVSPPEVHYRDATLTLPLIVVDSGTTASGATTVRHLGTRQVFPNTTLNERFENPLERGRVNVTVKSDYYQAWGRFFARRTDGSVVYNHSRDTMTATLTVPIGPRTVESAVAASSASGRIVLTGTDPRTDSYTSADGDGYAGDEHDEGTVRTAGDIVVGGDTSINGSVASGGSIDFDGGGDAEHEVTGDARYTDTISPDKSSQLDKRVAGDVEQIGGVESDPPIGGYVTDRVETLKAEGTDLGAVTADETITSGDYYADVVDLNGETLTIDTTGGNVSLGVRDYVRLNNSARIEVRGNHKVRIYVLGEDTATSSSLSYNPKSRPKVDEFHVLVEDSEIVTPTTTGGGVRENATQVWIYGDEDLLAGTADSKTVGVVYAPSGVDGESTFLAGGQSEHYGGVVTGYVYIENKGAVHYDRALLNQKTVPERQNIIRLTYLHVSVNRIAISG